MAAATGEARGAMTTSDPNAPRPSSVSDAEIDRTAHLLAGAPRAAAVAEARALRKAWRGTAALDFGNITCLSSPRAAEALR
jgi:hypothetical protein